MENTIKNYTKTILGDTQIRLDILDIAVSYILDYSFGILNSKEINQNCVLAISKAAAKEYENMVKEDSDLKTYTAGDITLQFSDSNLVDHLTELSKVLSLYRKIRW